MSNFTFKHANGAAIKDGLDILRVTTQADGSQKIEVFVETAAAFSEIFAHPVDAAPAPDPTPDPDPFPDPAPDPVPDPTPGPAADINGPAELAQALQSGSGTYTLAGGDYGGMPSVPDGTILRAADPANPPRFNRFSLSGVSDVTVDGLHFKYTYSPGDPDHEQLGYVSNAARINFLRCLFEGDVDEGGAGKGRGLRMWGSSTDVMIDQCEFRTWWKAMALDGDNITVRGCDIHTIRSDGINTGTVNNLLIEGNYIHDFGTAGAAFDHRDMIQFIGPANGIVVRDNFFDRNLGYYAQVIWSDAKDFMDNVQILRNVIINSHTHGISMHNVGKVDVLDNVMVRQPRDDKNYGTTVPAINLSSGQATVARNIVPVIIAPSGVDGLNTLQDGDPAVTRAAARADARWAHFFGG